MDKMDKRIMLIVNPMAGKSQAKGWLLDIVQVFGKAGYATTVYTTQYAGHAVELAKTYGSEYPVIACIGGDGTLSEVITGLMDIPKEKRPDIGYIPLGTANDVASSLKLSKNPKQAAENIINGIPVEIDVGSFMDTYFAYIAAFGAFTQVSYATPQETKKALGHFAYVLEGMASLPKIMPYHTVMEYDEGVIEGNFIFGSVSNSTSVAGLVKLNPDSVGLDDGLFEIILVKNPRNVGEIHGIVSNILSHNFSNENIIFLHSQKVKFTFDEEIAWTRDGENGGKWQNITAENKSKAVRIIVNNIEKETK